MNDTDNGKHELCRKVGRLGAIIMQQEQIIALLLAEVKAWRDADESRDEERLPWDKAQAIIKAMNATDAAGALGES